MNHTSLGQNGIVTSCINISLISVFHSSSGGTLSFIQKRLKCQKSGEVNDYRSASIVISETFANRNANLLSY